MKSNKDYNDLKDHFPDKAEHWKLAKMVLLENYKTVYGIVTQSFIDDNGFGSVVMNDVENVYNSINYQSIIAPFIDDEVFKYTGLDIERYIKMPRHMRDDIHVRIRRLRDEKHNLVNNIIAEENKR